MSISKNKGFTLIELLVVISIIGLLSSVVLASLSSAREKGQIAAITQFVDNNYHSIGDKQLFYYQFNNTSNLGYDSSGNNKTAIISGSPIQDAISYSGSAGKSLKLTGYNQYLTVPDVILPKDADGYSISLWIKTSFEGAIPLVEDTSNEFAFAITGNAIGCGASVYEVSKSVEIDGQTLICDGKWHNITATVGTTGSGSNRLYVQRLYVDGKKEAAFTSSPPGDVWWDLSLPYLVPSLSILKEDNAWGDGRDTTDIVNIDDVAVFSGVLSLTEIQTIYLSGLDNRHVAQQR